MWGKAAADFWRGFTGAPSQKYTWRVAALQGSAFPVAEPFAKLRGFLHNIRILLNSLISDQKPRIYCSILWTNSNLPSRQQTEHLFRPVPYPVHSHRPFLSLLVNPPKTSHLFDTMADKLRTLQQLESLQAKYVGTGHADTTRHEWTSNIIRDSYASYIGHPPLLAYMAIGMGESKEIVRAQMIEAMIKGAGKPPAREDD